MVSLICGLGDNRSFVVLTQDVRRTDGTAIGHRDTETPRNCRELRDFLPPRPPGTPKLRNGSLIGLELRSQKQKRECCSAVSAFSAFSAAKTPVVPAVSRSLGVSVTNCRSRSFQKLIQSRNVPVYNASPPESRQSKLARTRRSIRKQ